MVSLKDLVERMERVELTILGQVFHARVLSAADLAMLDELRPEPLPPANLKDPGKGSLAPMIENPGDLEHRRAVARYWPEFGADCVVAAIAKADPRQLCDEPVRWPTLPTGGGEHHEAARKMAGQCLEAGGRIVRALPLEALLAAASAVRNAMVKAAEPGGAAEKN